MKKRNKVSYISILIYEYMYRFIISLVASIFYTIYKLLKKSLYFKVLYDIPFSFQAQITCLMLDIFPKLIFKHNTLPQLYSNLVSTRFGKVVK